MGRPAASREGQRAALLAFLHRRLPRLVQFQTAAAKIKRPGGQVGGDFGIEPVDPVPALFVEIDDVAGSQYAQVVQRLASSIGRRSHISPTVSGPAGGFHPRRRSGSATALSRWAHLSAVTCLANGQPDEEKVWFLS